MKLSASAKIKIIIFVAILLLIWTFFSPRLLILGKWAQKHDYDYFDDYSSYDSQEEYAEENNVTFGLFTAYSFESGGDKESGNYHINGDSLVTVYNDDGDTVTSETMFKATEFTLYNFGSWGSYYDSLEEEDNSEWGYERVGLPPVYIFRVLIVGIAVLIIFIIRRNSYTYDGGYSPSSGYRPDKREKRMGLHSTVPPSIDDVTYYRPPVSSPHTPSVSDYGVPGGYYQPPAYMPADYGAGAVDINPPAPTQPPVQNDMEQNDINININ